MDDVIATVLEILCPLFSLVCAWPIWLAIAGHIEQKALHRKKMQEAKVDIPAQSQQAMTPTYIPPVSLSVDPTQITKLSLPEEADNKGSLQLKNSQLMKDVLKLKSAVEQEQLKMIQQGATESDIANRYGADKLPEVQALLSRTRVEIFAKIEQMAKSGMTREQIFEKLRSQTAISPTVDPDIAVQVDRKPEIQDQHPTPDQTDNPPLRRAILKSIEADFPCMPDLIPAPEGRRKPKTNYAVVRSAKLRKAAIQIHGRNCSACGFNFDETFGENLAQGYIEVHHLNSIAAGVRNTDPTTDLAPLCSNCHAMADRLTRHHISPPRSIGELRKLLFPVCNLPDTEMFSPDEMCRPIVKSKIGKARKKKPKKTSE